MMTSWLCCLIIDPMVGSIGLFFYQREENRELSLLFALALAHAFGYMDSNKLRILTRAFVISTFLYSPLVCMSRNRQLNSRSNGMHKRSLRNAHKDCQSKIR